MRARLYYWSFTNYDGGFRSIISRQIRKQSQPLILRDNSPPRLVFGVESTLAVFPSLSPFGVARRVSYISSSEMLLC